MTGNPCAGFKDYRNFVIAVLPRLKTLDGTGIEISERLLARQRFAEVRESVLHCSVLYCTVMEVREAVLKQEEAHLAARQAERQQVCRGSARGQLWWRETRMRSMCFGSILE